MTCIIPVHFMKTYLISKTVKFTKYNKYLLDKICESIEKPVRILGNDLMRLWTTTYII